MQIQIFSIPAFGSQIEIDEMNKFVRSVRVLDIEKHFVTTVEGSFWSFCIRYTNGQTAATAFEKKERIDYRLVLEPTVFARFEKLRIIRKQIADSEAIPAYAVFIDAELAEMAQKETLTLADLRKVKGIGEKKAEKYGETIVHFINQA